MADAVARAGRRPPVARLILAQWRFNLLGFFRSPMAAFFTLILPVLFVVLISATTGNPVVVEDVRLAQFIAPSLLMFGVAMGTFTLPAITLAFAREQGLLKRMRGTPLPTWAFLAGQILYAVTVAVLAAAIVLVVAVSAFGVRLVPASLPAATVTLLLSVTTFAALAFAIVALVPRATTVQTATNGGVILLAFVSNIFVVSDAMPAGLRLLGDVFPLKHAVDALQTTFDPYLTTSPWSWDHLGVLALWGALGAGIAVWRFSWQPPSAARHGAAETTVAEDRARPAVSEVPVREVGRPDATTLLRDQVRATTRLVWRETDSVFFAIAMPIALVIMLPLLFDDAQVQGVPLAAWIAPAMAAYGIAVHAFVNVPEQLARSRERGVLKRMRGTPLPLWVYLGGQWGSVLAIGALILLGCLGAGMAVHGNAVSLTGLPALVGVFLVGTTVLAALGLALAAVVKRARSVPAVALALLLPLSFLSDVFVFGVLPRALDVIGWAFPLRHLVHGLAITSASDTPVLSAAMAGHLGVLLVYGLAGAWVARRGFAWDPPAGAVPLAEPAPADTRR